MTSEVDQSPVLTFPSSEVSASTSVLPVLSAISKEEIKSQPDLDVEGKLHDLGYIFFSSTG